MYVAPEHTVATNYQFDHQLEIARHSFDRIRYFGILITITIINKVTAITEDYKSQIISLVHKYSRLQQTGPKQVRYNRVTC